MGWVSYMCTAVPAVLTVSPPLATLLHLVVGTIKVFLCPDPKAGTCKARPWKEALETELQHPVFQLLCSKLPPHITLCHDALVENHCQSLVDSSGVAFGKNRNDLFPPFLHRDGVIAVNKDSGAFTGEYLPEQRTHLYGITAVHPYCPGGKIRCFPLKW